MPHDQISQIRLREFILVKSVFSLYLHLYMERDCAAIMGDVFSRCVSLVGGEPFLIVSIIFLDGDGRYGKR